MNTPEVQIGKIKVGGGNPIVIQSMTNTDTADARATADQIMELADAGSEMVRFTVDCEEAAQAVPEIRKILDEKGYAHIPIIGDFHFIGHELLEKYPECAEKLDKYRINPGNEKDEKFVNFIKIAIKNKKPVRIGGNKGSMDGNLVENTLSAAQLAEELGLPQNQIIVSAKVSDVQDLIKANELLAKSPYTIHLGLTEAGSGLQGVVLSTSALSILLNKGIGDTIRVSLTPQEGHPRTEEVKVCKEILQSLDLRQFRPRIVSCPGCGRTNNELFQKIVKNINAYADKTPLKKDLHIAIMGCIVNGPGEARDADIGLFLPGKNEQQIASVYLDGVFHRTIAENIEEEFTNLLDKNFKIG